MKSAVYPVGDQLAGTIAVLLSDCPEVCDGGCSDGGDVDGSDGFEDGERDSSEGWLLGAEGDSDSDDGVLLGGLLSDDGGLLGDDEGDGDEDGDDDEDGERDDGELLLDLGQQPSPRTRTSHLSLSAKCFAKP